MAASKSTKCSGREISKTKEKTEFLLSLHFFSLDVLQVKHLPLSWRDQCRTWVNESHSETEGWFLVQYPAVPYTTKVSKTFFSPLNSWPVACEKTFLSVFFWAWANLNRINAVCWIHSASNVIPLEKTEINPSTLLGCLYFATKIEYGRSIFHSRLTSLRISFSVRIKVLQHLSRKTTNLLLFCSIEWRKRKCSSKVSSGTRTCHLCRGVVCFVLLFPVVLV